MTKIHEACAAEGRCVISQGTLQPAAVLSKMLDALRELAPAAYQQVTMPGAGFSVIPSYALDDKDHEWWNGEDSDAALVSIIEALNEHAPEGFAFLVEGKDSFGFYPHGIGRDPRESMIRVLAFCDALYTRDEFQTCCCCPLYHLGDHEDADGFQWRDQPRARVQLEVHTTKEGAAKLRERFAAGPLSVAGVGVLSVEDAEADDDPDSRPELLAEQEELEAPSQSVLDTMFAWHGGQGSMLYAAASCWQGGHTVKRETAEAALGELERFEHHDNFDPGNVEAIDDLRAHLGVQDIAEPTPLDRFVQDLIGTRLPIPWRRGASRKAVEQRLNAIGFQLCEDGASYNPRLKRFFAAPNSDAKSQMLANQRCRTLTQAEVAFLLEVEADDDPETGDVDPEDAPEGWWIVSVKAMWVSPMGVDHEAIAAIGSCDLSGDNTAERVAQEHGLHEEALIALNEKLRAMIVDALSIVAHLRIP